MGSFASTQNANDEDDFVEEEEQDEIEEVPLFSYSPGVVDDWNKKYTPDQENNNDTWRANQRKQMEEQEAFRIRQEETRRIEQQRLEAEKQQRLEAEQRQLEEEREKQAILAEKERLAEEEQQRVEEIIQTWENSFTEKEQTENEVMVVLHQRLGALEETVSAIKPVQVNLQEKIAICKQCIDENGVLPCRDVVEEYQRNVWVTSS